MKTASRVLVASGITAAAAGLAVSTAVAGGTAARAGATYKGTVAGTGTSPSVVTFKVSSNGAHVTHLRVGPYPLNKCGSGGAPPRQTSQPATITKAGKFTGHVLYHGGGHVFAKAKVTGEFLRGGKERGSVTGTSSASRSATRRARTPPT